MHIGNWSIRARLGASFGAVLLVSAIALGIGVTQLRSIGEAAHSVDTVAKNSPALTQLDQQITTTTEWMIGLGIAALLLSVACVQALSRSIQQPLAEAELIAETVAAGDLSQEFETERTGPFGALLGGLGRMEDMLTDLIARIKTSTDSITEASHRIAAGNTDLSQRTEQQAATLEETASSMSELTAMVQQNTERAREANRFAQSASGIAERGGEVMTAVVDTMQAIDTSSKKVADIVDVIQGIAFQTNILALNAAVEAARAGEQGRGFAVVAGEVRTLAQRSAAAAREIKALIDDSVQQVGSGSDLVGKAGHTMHEIVGAVRHVTTLLSEIGAASEEQSTGIAQVAVAVTQMDTVTQQNAALVEQAAAASNALADEARELQSVVARFRLEAGPAPMSSSREPSLRLAAAR
ncbi:methyl-accepting chemotaxis protein [Cupriavidus gilardii]|uniref:methyl-accepting chemotaxis protein n=1 Tax=Cupriavidus gilardii TaxID=82541 RepID=UPI001ABE340F|nr:methyl-accepting chemotaxis protein [Cupriavidus gilardii]MBO4123054.1 methyl-accepting chemotaxis protein [Cupriavidus gilardii]